jgi:class 3 adenylate cyclase
MRLQETRRVFPRLINNTQYNRYHFAFYFDVRLYVREESIWGLSITLFVLFLLVGASLMFSADANKWVVHPVENMMKRVQAIRDDPLIALKMSDEEFKAEELARLARARRTRTGRARKFVQEIFTCDVWSTRSALPLETVILEKTIIKLGSLLALGFGEAGANIIRSNMRGGHSAGINAMITGTCVSCIIGVATVRKFGKATQVLQGRIMTIVNQIAEIVHGVVDEFHGAPNKNNGDTFLVIWRLDEEGLLKTRMSEMSIVAFSKILGSLYRSPVLDGYRSHPGLRYHLGDQNLCLSFGLHAGWAVEGAVGSEFKIDASYLSPNVSIAKSVEYATRVYGVSLIVAESVIRNCTQDILSVCRLIDRVRITGDKNPMELYCVDLDVASVEADSEEPLGFVWNTRNRYKARQFLESEKETKKSQDFSMASVFEGDETIRTMRRRYTIEFFQLFNMGYQNYSQGEWKVARRMLSYTRKVLGGVNREDGPSQALLRFMEETSNFEAPKDWQGFHDLDDSIL